MKKQNKNDDLDTIQREKQLYYIQNRANIFAHRLVVVIIAAFILVIAYVVFSLISGGNESYNIKSDSLNSQYLNPVRNDNNEDADNSASEGMVDYSHSIICWGDSFSDNAANSTNFYTYYLSELLAGRGSDINAVFSSGIEGDDMLTIAAKQGGIPMVVQPFTIPSTTNPVEISLQSSNGSNIIIQDKLNSGLNPCSIAGVEGKIEYVNGKLSFTRNTAGEEVILTTATTVVTNAMANIKDYIAVFFFGDDPTEYTPEEVVEIYRSMVNFNGNDRYVIIGSITGDEATLAPYEEALTSEFKNHYINLREYLTADVFNDYDLTITSNDARALREGSVPPSFILNGKRMADQGSEIVANVLFDRLLQLQIIK